MLIRKEQSILADLTSKCIFIMIFLIMIVKFKLGVVVIYASQIGLKNW